MVSLSEVEEYRDDLKKNRPKKTQSPEARQRVEDYLKHKKDREDQLKRTRERLLKWATLDE